MAYTKNKLTYHPTIKVGDKFGKWTIIDNTIVRQGPRKSHCLKAKCECGKEQMLYVYRLQHDHSMGCIGCTRSGSAHYKWAGVGKLSGSVLHNIKRNAKLHNRKVDLTLEYLWELFLKQNQCCALTGIKLDPWISNNKKQGLRMSASLDRINSSKDYLRGNVQWVHKDINKLKTDFPQQKFIELCKLVAKYNEK